MSDVNNLPPEFGWSQEFLRQSDTRDPESELNLQDIILRTNETRPEYSTQQAELKSNKTRLGELAIAATATTGFGASIVVIFEQFETPPALTYTVAAVSSLAVAFGCHRASKNS